MIESIISNNCTGGAVAHSLGMQFKSPIINCKIMPEDYPKLCKNLKEYMSIPMQEYTELSQDHKVSCMRFWGCIPDFPKGIIGDVMVIFQHYKTYEEGAAAWERRKGRIDYQNIGFIFHVNQPQYQKEVCEFMNLGLPNSLVLTEGFSMRGTIPIMVEPGEFAFTIKNGHYLFLDAFDFKKWRDKK